MGAEGCGEGWVARRRVLRTAGRRRDVMGRVGSGGIGGPWAEPVEWWRTRCRVLKLEQWCVARAASPGHVTRAASLGPRRRFDGSRSKLPRGRDPWTRHPRSRQAGPGLPRPHRGRAPVVHARGSGRGRVSHLGRAQAVVLRRGRSRAGLSLRVRAAPLPTAPRRSAGGHRGMRGGHRSSEHPTIDGKLMGSEAKTEGCAAAFKDRGRAPRHRTRSRPREGDPGALCSRGRCRTTSRRSTGRAARGAAD